MKLIKFIVAGSFLLLASNTFAACPSELPEEMLMDCIVAEGAGDFSAAEKMIQEWKDSNKAETQDMDNTADQVSYFYE